MDVNVNLNAVNAPLKIFKKLASELEILATKEFEHDKRVKGMLRDPTVKERKIFPFYVFSDISFTYRVEDYALDEEKKLVLLGQASYTSEDLRDRTRHGGGGSAG